MYPKIYIRIYAFLIDVVLIYLASATTFFLLAYSKDYITFTLFAWPCFMAYFIFSWLKFDGQTLGSKIFKIKVVSTRNSRISFWNAFLRSVIITMIAVPVGVLPIVALFNIIVSIYTIRSHLGKEKQQTFWDIATKTCVVEIR